MFDFKNNSNESKMSKTEKYLREGRGESKSLTHVDTLKGPGDTKSLKPRSYVTGAPSHANYSIFKRGIAPGI